MTVLRRGDLPVTRTELCYGEICQTPGPVLPFAHGAVNSPCLGKRNTEGMDDEGW